MQMENKEAINQIIKYYKAKRLRDIKLGRTDRINKDAEIIKSLQNIRTDLENYKLVENKKLLFKCPQCHKDMVVDDSDSDYCFLSNETYALSHTTNWYICPSCGMSCIVKKEYSYYDRNGNELIKEPDDEMPEDYGRYKNDDL